MIADLIQTKFDEKRGETGESLFSLMGHKGEKIMADLSEAKLNYATLFFLADFLRKSDFGLSWLIFPNKGDCSAKFVLSSID